MKVIDLQKVSRRIDLQISEHFCLSEFLVTSTGYKNDDINSSVLGNLFSLCHLVLEPVREMIKEPIYITSGYRSIDVNNAVKGSPNSFHLSGLASDVACPSDDYGYKLIDALTRQNNFLNQLCRLNLYFYFDKDRHYTHVNLSCSDPLDLLSYEKIGY